MIKKTQFLIKTIISITLIATFSWFIFYLGHEPFDYAPHFRGIAHTKTSGVKKEILKSKEFYWFYEKLLPNNYSLEVYNIGELFIDLSINNELPSGKLYAEFLKGDASLFNYSFTIKGSLIFKEELLLEIFNQNTTIEDLYKILLLKIKEQTILELAKESSLEEIDAFIKKIIDESHYFTAHSIYIEDYKGPDLVLYKSIKGLFLKNLEEMNKQQLALDLKKQAQELEDSARLKKLEQYADLIKRNEKALEFFTILSDEERKIFLQ